MTERGRRIRGVTQVVCALALICARSATAPADTRPTIVLVRADDGDDRIARRLNAELEQLGFKVIELPATTTPPSHESLEQAARAKGAFAAVRVVPSRKGVEVWLADRVTGKTVLREIVVDAGETPDDVVAVRTVELLRASLIELQLPHELKPEVPVSKEMTALLPPPRKEAEPSRSEPARFFLQLGPATALSPGGLRPQPSLWLGGGWRPNASVSAELYAMLPLAPSVVRGPEGRSDVSVLIAGAATSLEWELAKRWRLDAGTGIAIAYLRMSGSAEPPLKDRTDGAFATAPHLLGRVRYALGESFWIGLDVRCGLALPQPSVRFAGREAASWGRPFVLLSVPFRFDPG